MALTILAGAAHAAPRQYLLVPGIPTPNGPLHLGHVAGPFLRCDVLARFRRMLGDQAQMISGSDSYEAYVLLRAIPANEPPIDVARRYHDVIDRDLRSLDIAHDLYIQPTDPPWNEPYLRWHAWYLAELERSGRLRWREETVPYSPRDGRHLVSCLLLGRCPECGEPAGGYTCESCAAWFAPRFMREPRARLAGGPVEWRRVRSLFLELDPAALLHSLDARGAPPEHRLKVERYLEREGPYLRLTQPLEWGVPLDAITTGERTGANLFSYGMSHAAYSALFGEAFAQAAGMAVNALDPASDVVTVTAHGIDHVMTHLVGLDGVHTVVSGMRTYGHFLFNSFMELEGRKFSTSSGPVIWVSDAVAEVDSDLLRFGLAAAGPVDRPTNFTIDGFVRTVQHRLLDGLQRVAVRCVELVAAADGVSGGPPDPLLRRLDELLEAQARAWRPEDVRLNAGLSAIDRWCELCPDSALAAYWWLSGAALLSAAVMPRWAASAWRVTGRAGPPSMRGLVPARRTSPGPQLHRFRAPDPRRLRALVVAGPGAPRRDLAPAGPATDGAQ